RAKQPKIGRVAQSKLIKNAQPAPSRRLDAKAKKIPSDYEVGYGRPPQATRFKKGQSGNPRGRTKGSRPVGALLQDILSQLVPVTENGRTRRLPALEVMLRRLANDAMRNDR